VQIWNSIVMPKQVLTASTSHNIFVIIAIAFVFVGCEKGSPTAPGAFPAPAVSVAKVIQREITPWEEFSGRIEAKEVVQIRSRVGGVIEKTRYREGDIVKKGDLLFTIEKQVFQAELNRAEAEAERARAQAKLSQVERQRATDLLKRKLISQDEYDQRIAAEHQANANVRAAEATKRLAHLNFGYTDIRSPINGRTGRALVTNGNLVSASPSPTPDLLTTVVSLDPVYVVFDCDELTYLEYFGNSQQSAEYNGKKRRTVYVGLGNEEGFSREGYVDFVDNKVNPDTGTIRLRAVLENKDYKLTPGLFARVKLMGNATKVAVLIDDLAILTDQNRKYVYLLGPENRAMRRDISLGRIVEGLRVVEKGINGDEKVIVHGIQKVFFPNMPVNPQTITMGDPPPLFAPKPKADH